MADKFAQSVHYYTVLPFFSVCGMPVAHSDAIHFFMDRPAAMRKANALMVPDKWGNREFCQCIIIPPLKVMSEDKMLIEPEEYA